MSDDTVDATVYLQVAPVVSGYLPDSNPNYVQSAKVVGSTQNKSGSPRRGTVEVKLTVRIPKSAFLPLRPEAVVIIPESLTQPHPVEVEALDANDKDTDA